MTNNEKFCAFINSCEHPRLVLESLRAMAPIIRKARAAGMAAAEQPEKSGVEILTDRLNACKHRRKIYNALLALGESLEEGEIV